VFTTMVGPLFCERLASSTIVEGWICLGALSRIWVMGVVDGEVNEVEHLERAPSDVVCTREGLVCTKSGTM